jgi:hypothetical protein
LLFQYITLQARYLLNEAQAKGDLLKASGNHFCFGFVDDAVQAEGMRMVGNAVGQGLSWRFLALDHIDELTKTAATAISKIKIDKLVIWDTGSDSHSIVMNNIKSSLQSISTKS